MKNDGSIGRRVLHEFRSGFASEFRKIITDYWVIVNFFRGIFEPSIKYFAIPDAEKLCPVWRRHPA